jgi:DNA-binding beta-propeller fold protein YncE
MCYDSTDDKVYYASYSFRGEVGAIDPATNKPVAHIQVGPTPQDIVWHAPTNRVYCGGGADITVIDPAADTVTKVLPVAGFLLCSAPRVSKVYAYDGNNSLSVIDCGSDSVTKTIPLPDVFWVSAMCYVAYDKLYVSGFYDVFVIDCIKDSLIRIHHIKGSLVRAGREGKRVHCATSKALRTFDPAGDTLIAEVPWDVIGGRDMIYASGVDKLYVNTDSSVLVADGATDSLVAEIELEDTWAIGYDSASNLVCCGQTHDSTLTFIDSRTDAVVTSFNSGFRPETFTPVPAHRRVFVGGWSGSFIPVIRTDPPGVTEAARFFTPRKSAVPTILPRSSPFIVAQPSVLLNTVGRKVLDLKPGKNGLAGCRTGVYFLRNCTDGTIVKILLVD